MEERDIRKKIRKILLETYLKEEVSKEKRYKVYLPVPEDVEKIKNDLKSFGYECYMVGGCTRDAILGVTPKDYDLVTNALPDKTIEILKGKDYVKYILETGKKFGIVNVITYNDEYEIASYREDMSKGRHPDVKLNATIESDSNRRDLTFNALYYDIDNQEVIDFTGGFEDLKNREINTVGDPNERFREDALRLIRIIRFYCRLNSAKFKEDTIEAIKNNLHLLSTISSERIRDEFLKGIKGAKSVVKYLDLLSEFGFYKYIFGNLNVDAKSFVEEKHPIIIVANILKNNGIKEIVKELNFRKYGVDETNCFIFLISLLNLNENTASAIKKFYLQKVKAAKPKINGNIYSITEEVMNKFSLLNNIDKIKIINFLKLANEFRQPSELLKAMGYQDKDLGIAIERLEKEFYKNPERVKKAIDSGDKEEIKKIIFIKNN